MLRIKFLPIIFHQWQVKFLFTYRLLYFLRFIPISFNTIWLYLWFTVTDAFSNGRIIFFPLTDLILYFLKFWSKIDLDICTYKHMASLMHFNGNKIFRCGCVYLQLELLSRHHCIDAKLYQLQVHLTIIIKTSLPTYDC